MQKWIDYCLGKKGAALAYPFGVDVPVINVGSKMFALFGIQEDGGRINLKCDPDRSAALREQYAAIQPGYHMNKRHWNTVIVDGSLTDEEISMLIDHSYELVFKGLKKAEKEKLNK
ncbi:MmcQ/YjbR family DNA-binding protein [Brevibacillus sp. H7]|jgi:predicted DNA-binding protein (MmcQ/YjbR family)|uniref:MmcQ/YjbR family DNA-binding protein n=1 Tax=Brevibacillus sp. H7 TaxID=3349138 RepID=UPI0037F8C3CC